jgi:hypothetical protein
VAGTAALLTTVASLLVRRPVPVVCHHPPGEVWPERVLGETTWPRGRAHVYLRGRICARARRLEGLGVLVFAHELIHVEHLDWPERRVQRWDDWYARTVVGPAIRRARRRCARPAQRVAWPRAG